jgi:SAM-dependent methyltransferase
LSPAPHNASDPNLRVYRRQDVVDYYDKLTDLQECERRAFAHLRPGTRVLDLGVGGGRTTQHLARQASDYLGVDYSAEMVELCRRKFPDLRFEHGDAADLSFLDDGTFDAVVFSFNGLCYLHPDERRRSCLREVRRVLRPGGMFIFSLHNSRHIFVRPLLRGTDLKRKVWRTLRAGGKTLQLTATMLRSAAFWAGEGYVLDPVHGGLKTYVTNVRRCVGEAAAHGFDLVEWLGGNEPASGGPFTQPWYYYVLRRPDP